MYQDLLIVQETHVLLRKKTKTSINPAFILPMAI